MTDNLKARQDYLLAQVKRQDEQKLLRAARVKAKQAPQATNRRPAQYRVTFSVTEVLLLFIVVVPLLRLLFSGN